MRSSTSGQADTPDSDNAKTLLERFVPVEVTAWELAREYQLVDPESAIAQQRDH